MENVSVSNPPISLLSHRFVDRNNESKSNSEFNSPRTSNNNNSDDSGRYDELSFSSYVLQYQQPKQQQRCDLGPQLSPMSKSVVTFDKTSSSTPADTNLSSSSVTVTTGVTATLSLPTSSPVTSTETQCASSLSLQQQLLITTPHHAVYSQMPDMLWKHPRLISVPFTASNFYPVFDDHPGQERIYFHKRESSLERQDRFARNKAEEREVERQRGRQQDKEKRERDRLEKQKAEQAVHEHFRKSQTLGYKKNSCWNFLGSAASMAPVSAPSVRIDDNHKKQTERDEPTLTRAELKTREFPAVVSHSHHIQKQKCSTGVSNGKNEFSSSAVCNLICSPSISASSEVVQNRVNNSSLLRVQISSPKSVDPVYSNMYKSSSYPTQSLNFIQSDKQQHQEIEPHLPLKSTMIVGSSSSTGVTTTVTSSPGSKSCSLQVNLDRESLIVDHVPSLPPQQLQQQQQHKQQHLAATMVGTQPGDLQNSVIVKNEGRNFTSNVSVSSSEFISITNLVTNTSALLPHSSNSKLKVNTTAATVTADVHNHLQSSSNIAKACEYRVTSSQPSSTLHASAAVHMLNVSGIHQFTDQQKLPYNRHTSASPSPAPHQRQSPTPVTFRRLSPQHLTLPITIQQSSPSIQSYQCMPVSIRTSSPFEQPSRPVTTAAATSSLNSSNIYPKTGVAVGSHSCQTSSVPIPLSLQCPTTCVPIVIKPKVSSPVPSQIYGKPTSGLSSDVSSSSSSSPSSSSPSTSFVLCRSQENAMNAFNMRALITPSPFQQLSQHQLPPNVPAASSLMTTTTTAVTIAVTKTSANYAPPPAHSASAGSSISVLAELNLSNSCGDSDAVNIGPDGDHPERFSPKNSISSIQIQPLNLGFKDYSKNDDITNERIVMLNVDDLAKDDDVNAIRHDSCENCEYKETARKMCHGINISNQLLDQKLLVNNASGDTSSPLSWQEADKKEDIMSPVAIPSRCCSVSTPVTKAAILSIVDGDMSNGPKSANYRGHKLKKTWLQRHSGEDALEVKNDGLMVATITAATAAVTTTIIITNLCSTSTVCSSSGSPVHRECDVRTFPSGDIGNTVEKQIACDSAKIAHSATLADESENLLALDGSSSNKSLNNICSMVVDKIRQSEQTHKKIDQNEGGSNYSSIVIVNGYPNPEKDILDTNSDDSSGSAAEVEIKELLSHPKKLRGPQREQNTAAQHIPGLTSPKRKKLHSCSSTDSEKGSVSEKELDAGIYTANGGGKGSSNLCCGDNGNNGRSSNRSDGSRKRGRKPKISGSSSNGGGSSGSGEYCSSGSGGGGGDGDGDENGAGGSAGGSDRRAADANNFCEEPKEKRFRDDSRKRKDPFHKPPINQLKKTGESFLQDGPCHEVAPKLAKCRECRWTVNQRSKSNSNIFCRFYAFRRLRYTKNGQLAIAGFSDPHTDAGPDDVGLWLPDTKNPPSDLDLEVARFTLVQVGDQFCDLLTQEAEAINIHIGEDKKIAWKRVVQGVREMCDVCETTLFNFHWACSKCGFVVCIDCYKGRKNGTVKMWRECAKDRDDLSWLLCTNRQPHEQEKLMLTQIIAGDALMMLARLAHETRAMWDIAMFCGCPMATNAKPSNGICKEILRSLKREKQKNAEQLNGCFKHENVAVVALSEHNEKRNDESDSPLNWLADVALSDQNKPSTIVATAAQITTAAPLTPPLPVVLTTLGTVVTPTATAITSTVFHTVADDEGDSSDDSEDGSFSTLRELLIRPSFNKSANSTHAVTTSTSTTPAIATSTITITTLTAPAVFTTTTTATNAPTSEQIDSQPETITCSAVSIVSSAKTSITCGASAATANKLKTKKSLLDNFDLVLSNVGECIDDNGEDYLSDNRFLNNSGVELKYFVRRHTKNYRGRGQMPIRIMTLSESKLLYPDVPHSWLCDGKLLRLLDATHPGNYTIFQDQWRRGQPVIVSDVTKRLDPSLWHPDSFIKDFGDVKNDLINCMTGNIVPNQQMRKFWEGFEYLSRRLKDEKGNDMLLKLKDWPPGEDFAEMLPSRYNDLMKVLPLGEYTQRGGRLNLASRLPECFVRPDLGPKMYNAYGSAVFSNKGTTNLHLDISDAVNVMVYVGIPKDADNEEHVKEAYRAIDEAGCDILTRRRVREKGELPGALWHIYSARDADKIRDLLNKVAIERGVRLEPNHDPIHDQSCYLDGSLRERLFKEYSVEGYAIVQCMGDAVFVPAGAPHQVRNLHNCIKVAEDFVSPENVSHCFHLTQEFRDLSDTHSNHEDKLQIKNIMYHAVKDSLSVLGAAIIRNSCRSNDRSTDSNEAEESKRIMAPGIATTVGNIITNAPLTTATHTTDSTAMEYNIADSTAAKTFNVAMKMEEGCEMDT